MKFARSVATVSIFSVVCLCGIGCDKAKEEASEALKKRKEVAKKGEEIAKKDIAAVENWTEETLKKAKEEFSTLTEGHLGPIEEKIKKMSGDSMTEAKELFEKLKEKAASVKEAAPEKFAELKKEAEELLHQLKSKVGL